jgi:hypothetical protein
MEEESSDLEAQPGTSAAAADIEGRASEPEDPGKIPSDNPWPFLDRFFVFMGTGKTKANVRFECVLCLPVTREIRAHTTSFQNLKSHMQKYHSASMEEFVGLITSSSARGRGREKNRKE